MANSRPRRRSPDPRIGGPNNSLRVDLYRRLIPQLAEQDQKSGAQGYVLHWNDPSATWNKANDIRALWNAVGLSPIIQTLFYVLETLEGEEIDVLESLDCIIDPFGTPADLLDDLAASFGYRLAASLDEDTQRIIVQGLFDAYKALGQRISFDVFYRMIGFKIAKVYPLWKKAVNEDQNRYSRERYVANSITAEPVGPAGSTSYVTTLGDPPIVPGSVRITDGTVVLKDQPDGYVADGLVMQNTATIIGPGNETGTINYTTGDLTVTFDGVTAGAVTVSYDQVSDEFPYRAARMDVEVLMNPATIIPLVDAEVVGSLLSRLDEVRPIHVVLRVMTLAFELTDDVDPTASDATACATFVSDSRDPTADGTAGLEHRYISEVAPRGEDELAIEHSDGGTLTTDTVLEDLLNGFVIPGLDVLQIEADVDQTV